MEEIFKQYSGPIIIAIVIVALIALFGIVLSTKEGSLVLTNFRNLIDNFFRKANLASGVTIIQSLKMMV